MYEFFSRISGYISEPLIEIAYGSEGIPFLSALILGLVGAVAPCQFTGNLGAITIYGNQSLQEKVAWKEVLFFILGKIVVFSGLGLIVWILGQEFQGTLTTYFFPWVRKLIGPMLVFIGLFMLGVWKMRWTLTLGKIPDRLKKGKLGAFFIGVSFSLGFCPTMFILFFVSLMPIVLSTPYGAILPSIFAIGTSLPLIIVVFLIWYFEVDGSFMKKNGRKVGLYVQRGAGLLMIVLGILDTFTYWTYL
ncbi:sulfite exporter TauE/SafE family protein [Pontibacillus sp. HMF3514]|uniref:urease accessory protein UreH domain-containing protein n=1 Tax=Pontibacillus sp. HMF3514 TaxID=2692425 RepID=UPI00131F53DD|nr:sulfite exporter TauE/SafE family protein [Pontibacillus sp. HMF3514]QHE52358.1 sulfite exporter TauE/SafE family protein [Pontibacillus sp. HMF3514]